MTQKRAMRLNAVLWGVGNHEAAWRMAESNPLAGTDLTHWKKLARIAEKGGFDSLFLGDVLALLAAYESHLSDTLDPITVLSALSATTHRIGLIGTLSTSFEPPYHIARRFASLDHLSSGRAGWNIVTSSNLLEAQNFGLTALPDHAERYARAAESINAVLSLWRGWQADARLGNQQDGHYLDASKVRASHFNGRYIQTAGPLNVPRSPQGRPLLVQAGASEEGRQLAAHFADVVFTAQQTLEDARAFYKDIKQRAVNAGRDPDSIIIMPGIMPVVATSHSNAQKRLDKINGGIIHQHAIAQLSEYLQYDASQFALDQPLPETFDEHYQIQTNQSRLTLILQLARHEHLTVRQLLQRIGGGRGHYLQVGTAQDIADTLQSWFEQGAADGFSIMSPVLPGDLTAFCKWVIPELQRRGLRPALHSASPLTLREKLGLPPVD